MEQASRTTLTVYIFSSRVLIPLFVFLSSLSLLETRCPTKSHDHISTFATIYAKLNEVGWVDELKHRGKGVCVTDRHIHVTLAAECLLTELMGYTEHARTMQPLHFQSLLSELESHGQGTHIPIPAI